MFVATFHRRGVRCPLTGRQYTVLTMATPDNDTPRSYTYKRSYLFPSREYANAPAGEFPTMAMALRQAKVEPHAPHVVASHRTDRRTALTAHLSLSSVPSGSSSTDSRASSAFWRLLLFSLICATTRWPP